MTDYSETKDGYPYSSSVKELRSYEVRMNGNKTADYTFKNLKDSASTLAVSSVRA